MTFIFIKKYLLGVGFELSHVISYTNKKAIIEKANHKF